MESSIIAKMKVPELRQRCIDLGLETKGLKAELIIRINEHYEKLLHNRFLAEEETSDGEDDEINDEDNDSKNEESNNDDEEDNNENESDEESIEIISKKLEATIKKTIGKNAPYNFVKKYENPEEAIEAIKTENCWIKGTKRENKIDGTKQNYSCRYHKLSDCLSKGYLLFHNNSDCVSFYKNEIEHNDHVKLSDRGITEELKSAFDGIYDIYPKLSQMKRQLTTMFPNVSKDNFPTDNQLKNYLNYKKQKEGLKAYLNLGELEKWCI